MIKNGMRILGNRVCSIKIVSLKGITNVEIKPEKTILIRSL
jgi:hypothetical protein